MPVKQLISYLGECRRRLSDLQARQDYLALSCALVRPEGAGGTVFSLPFAHVLKDKPFHPNETWSRKDTFALAFFPVADGINADRIPTALASVEAITGSIHLLVRDFPKALHEGLKLPESENWWRIVFHLAWHTWHCPSPFLQATRRRLLAKDGTLRTIADETFVQLHGTGGLIDLLPGLIYSELKHDLCTSSEAAIGVIVQTLERHAEIVSPAAPETPGISADQRRVFHQLRVEFLRGTQLPAPSLECKLLKLANSFETPPASEWANVIEGGCVERFITLSRLNDMQEMVQIRGPATEWFCEVARRAGEALPTFIPDLPILFDDPKGGFSLPCPVMDRGTLERWVGFVFSTLKQHANEALQVRWERPMGALFHGLATLDRDLFAASILVIDLAKLTSAAEESSNRERVSCSPFSVPSMEEQGFQFVEETPPAPPPPDNYTLGHLVQDLRQFGETYHQNAELTRQKLPAIQRHDQIQLGACVTHARVSLQAIPGFNELRVLAKTLWGEEISFAVGQRIVEALVQRSNGRLSPSNIEGLKLAEAASQLSAPPRILTTREPAPDPLLSGLAAEAGVTLSKPWTGGVFLAKVNELSRRLRSWHIEDYLSPVQFASESESRRWVRLMFRGIMANLQANLGPRPGKGIQLFSHDDGKPDQSGCVGEAYENPDRDTDRSLTMWLMGDFMRNLDAAPPLSVLDFLKESFGHILDLPAWVICKPKDAAELSMANNSRDEKGDPRCYLVTGRPIPTEFLDALTDAGEKLLAAAPPDWALDPGGRKCQTEIPNPVDFGIITVKEEEFTAVENRVEHVRHVRGENRSYLHGQVTALDGRIQHVLIARCLEQG